MARRRRRCVLVGEALIYYFCSDHQVQSINLPGGFLIKPGLTYNFSNLSNYYYGMNIIYRTLHIQYGYREAY